MRTTITLEPDVAQKIKQFIRQQEVSPKTAINELIRRGFFALQKDKAAPRKPIKLVTADFGIHPKLAKLSMNQLAMMSDEEIEAIINDES